MVFFTKINSSFNRIPDFQKNGNPNRLLTFNKTIWRHILGIAAVETSCDRRGFRVSNPQMRQRLESIGQTFLVGYHAAIEEGLSRPLSDRLNAVPQELRGFAFEGAAMGLVLLDVLTPWNCQRLTNFVQGAGASHAYMVYVGAGWIFAKLRLPIESYLQQLDPLLGWLMVDGYGFHQGYFHHQKYIQQQAIPQELKGYARRVFDKGLGRSLWFVEGGNIEAIASTITAFAPERQGDLWSGIGLACAYAGGVEADEIAELKSKAGFYRHKLGQGTAFAAKARDRADNPASHTETACQILCGMSASAAAKVTDLASENLPVGNAYEVWCSRIQSRLGMGVEI